MSCVALRGVMRTTSRDTHRVARRKRRLAAERRGEGGAAVRVLARGAPDKIAGLRVGARVRAGGHVERDGHRLPVWRRAGFELQRDARAGGRARDRDRGPRNYDAAGDTGGTSCFGPVTNLIRDPRWGRVNEMLGGEDTTLASVLGVAFTRGIQAGAAATAAAGAAGTPCRMVNTIAKHLSAYSGPEGYGAGVRFGTQSRFSFAASMDERTWREFYLPPWRAMAVEGNVSGFMSSYMAVALDGAGAVPDTANAAFLTDTIRGAAWRNWSGGDAVDGRGCVS
jgi:hypothetical protein